MSPPPDPDESARKGRRLVLRKRETLGGRATGPPPNARASGPPPRPTIPPPMRPPLPSSSFRPNSAEARDVPSEALPSSEAVPTLRRPPVGVSAITASAAASAHTATPVAPNDVPEAATSRTRDSVPPMVAGSRRPAGLLPAKQSSASTRAVLIGAALGLAIVAGLVLAARARQPPKSASATAVVVAPPSSPRAAERAVATASGADDSPSVSKPLQQPRTDVGPPAPLAVRSTPATTAPKARPPAYRTPAASKPIGATAAAPAPGLPAASSAGANGETPQDDGENSSVPVIPESAPAPADPLIQAVQNDIEEEEHAKAK